MRIIKIIKIKCKIKFFSDTRRTMIHLFLFTNSAQRELVSLYTQSIAHVAWLRVTNHPAVDTCLI